MVVVLFAGTLLQQAAQTRDVCIRWFESADVGEMTIMCVCVVFIHCIGLDTCICYAGVREGWMDVFVFFKAKTVQKKCQLVSTRNSVTTHSFQAHHTMNVANCRHIVFPFPKYRCW